MRNEYLNFFTDINDYLERTSDDYSFSFKIIGYVALALAGLAERGTKDVDALTIDKLETLASPSVQRTLNDLIGEYGKEGPGAIRNGMYLDFVDDNIPWLPPNPNFLFEHKLSRVKIHRLDPVDVCVSKTFSNFKYAKGRAQDENDILQALDSGIVKFNDYVQRIDDGLPKYELHSGADYAYPRIIEFITKLNKHYGPTKLNYQIPNWMENVQEPK